MIHPRNILIFIAMVIIATAMMFGLFLQDVEATKTAVNVTIRCTNENYMHSKRCNSPVDRFEYQNGNYVGSLLSGVGFSQNILIDGLSKYTMEDAFWYIDAKGSFTAPDDFTAFSIYLTRNYAQRY